MTDGSFNGADKEGSVFDGYDEVCNATLWFVHHGLYALAREPSFGPRWFPLLGYVESIGVDKENRYEPRQYPDDWYVGTTAPLFGSALPMTVRTQITVPADFVANGVG